MSLAVIYVPLVFILPRGTNFKNLIFFIDKIYMFLTVLPEVVQV